MNTNRVAAKDVKHELKAFKIREGKVFPFESRGDVKFPYFSKNSKRYYFVHPDRGVDAGFCLTDDMVTKLWADKNGNFAAAKCSLFVPVPVAKAKK